MASGSPYDADPFHRRMPGRQLAAEQADPTGADNRQPDPLAFCFTLETLLAQSERSR